MKTSKLKTIRPIGSHIQKEQPQVRKEREPPIWLSIIIQDIKDLLLITKDAVPTRQTQKAESWSDWEDTFRR